MKTKIYIGIIALLTSFVFNSCVSDEMETDKGSEALALSVSSKAVELNQLLSDREAFHFVWTAGSNQGTNSAISYTLEMDVKGNNFAGGLKNEIGLTDSRLLAFNHKEMNDLVPELWGSAPGTTLELEARVTAVVLGHKELTQVSPVITFQLTTYKERYLNLWMIGGATSGGWSLDRATAMESIENEPNGFVWEGALVAGELKFLLQRSSFTPSYNRDANAENKLIYRESDSDPDEKFVIPTPGNYRIKLNLNTLDIEITDLGGDVTGGSDYWIAGESAGGASIAMTKDVSNPAIYTYTGELKDGTFHIAKDEEDTETVVDGGQVYESKYTVTFHSVTKQLTVKQIVVWESVWIMGEAAPNGWSWDNIPQLTQSTLNKNEFTYEGSLLRGQVKFPLQVGNYDGLFIVAETDNKGVTDTYEGSCFVCPTDKGDNKWYINNAGNYKVTINTYKMSIHFEKK